MKIVTQLLEESKYESKRYFTKQCQKKIARLEIMHLRKQTSLCPWCKKETGFIRKGRRPRRIRTSEGEVCFDVQQILCRVCRRTYRPLISWLELQARQVITEELLEKGLAVALHTSYQVASSLTKALTGAGLGKRKIREGILHTSEMLRAHQAQEPPQDYLVILEDSTKGNTGKTKRGEDIHVVYGITGRIRNINKDTGEVKRSAMIGKILSVSVGTYDASPLQHRTACIMTDGAGGVQKKQRYGTRGEEMRYYRCTWHLSRMLGFALYHDGLTTKKERRPYVSKLALLIKHSFKNYKTYYQELLTNVKEQGLHKATKYLENAQQEFYNTKEHPILIDGVPLLATSPIERVMREIDRRVDNGARWSARGLEAITRVRLHFLYN